MMPFSTFLPANYAARRHHETPSAAARSVAWIAADDLLDAVDGSPLTLADDDIDLLVRRVNLVVSALEACLPTLKDGTSARASGVLDYSRRLAEHLSGVSGPLDLVRWTDQLPDIQRIRHVWEVWGPVARHPAVLQEANPATHTRRPLRRQAGDAAYWTM